PTSARSVKLKAKAQAVKSSSLPISTMAGSMPSPSTQRLLVSQGLAWFFIGALSYPGFLDIHARHGVPSLSAKGRCSFGTLGSIYPPHRAALGLDPRGGGGKPAGKEAG